MVTYVLDDQHLLWHAPRGETPAVAVPRELIPRVLGVGVGTHGTFGDPGAARATMLIERKYYTTGRHQEDVKIRKEVYTTGKHSRKM